MAAVLTLLGMAWLRLGLVFVFGILPRTLKCSVFLKFVMRTNREENDKAVSRDHTHRLYGGRCETVQSKKST